MKPIDKSYKPGTWIFLGIVLGMFLGLIFGKFAIGMIFGFFTGIVIDLLKRKAIAAAEEKPIEDEKA